MIITFLFQNIRIERKRIEQQNSISQHFLMIRPESLSQKRIYQYNRHDKPRNLSKTIGVGGTDNQYPEGISHQEGIVNPMIIFVLEVAAEDKVISHDNSNRAISQKVPTEDHTHLNDFSVHNVSC